MVLERLIPEKIAEKKLSYAFFLGVIYSIIGIFIASLLFPADPSLVAVAFTAILLIPTVRKIYQIEESELKRERKFSFKSLWHDENDFTKFYLLLILGIFLVYALSALILPSMSVNGLFRDQLELRGAGAVDNISGQATFTGGLFWSLLANNIIVLIACVIMSFLTGDGAIFLLTWNASLWGTIFGVTARNASIVSHTSPLLILGLILLLLPEAQTPLKEITNNPNFQDFFLHSINLSKSLTIFEMYVGLVVPLLTTTIAYNIGFSLDILTKIYKPNFWDINAEIYKLITTKVHKQLYKDILKQAGNLENKTIDEYGFGLGNLIELMPNSAIIRGFDISQTAKEKTEKLIGDKADLYLKDFYELANLDYKPEIIIASKVLYHPNLEESIEVLNNNIDPKGKVIIAHPKKKEKDYIFINQKGKKRLNLIALIKSSSRILSKYFSYNYSLFTEQEWQKNK